MADGVDDGSRPRERQEQQREHLAYQGTRAQPAASAEQVDVKATQMSPRQAGPSVSAARRCTHVVRSTETLWRWAVEVEPETSVCHGKLGESALGRPARQTRAAEAETLLAEVRVVSGLSPEATPMSRPASRP